MGMYEFKCKDCNHEFERILFSVPKEPLKCPFCEGEKLEKLISPIAKKSDMGNNSYPYVEHNIGDKPIVLESAAHRKNEMNKRGLRDAGKKPGSKGQWV